MDDENKVKVEVYDRLRRQFPPCNDAKFAEILGINPQQGHKYKIGANFINVLYISQRFPDLDWSYILTGRESNADKERKRIESELRGMRKELLKIANNVQTIEEQIIKQ